MFYNTYKYSELSLTLIVSIPLILTILYIVISVLYIRYLRVCNQVIGYVVKYRYIDEGYCTRIVFFKEYTYDNIIYSVPYDDANDELILLHNIDLLPGNIKVNGKNPREYYNTADCKLYKISLVILFTLISIWCLVWLNLM